MKLTPDTAREGFSHDDFLIHATAMLGSKLDGLNMKRNNKGQKISSPLGTLEYVPGNLSRNGCIPLSGMNGTVGVELHYRTYEVERITMDIGEGLGMLGPRRIELIIGEGSTLKSLTQTVSVLARRIVELEGKLK